MQLNPTHDPRTTASIAQHYTQAIARENPQGGPLRLRVQHRSPQMNLLIDRLHELVTRQVQQRANPDARRVHFQHPFAVEENLALINNFLGEQAN